MYLDPKAHHRISSFKHALFGGTLGGSEQYLPVLKMSQATNKIQSQFSTP
jgi:hypothetical protein